MKAVITINFEEYLVPDARKALALVEMLQKSQCVKRHLEYKPDQITLSSDQPRVEMRVVPASTKIVQPEKKKGKA